MDPKAILRGDASTVDTLVLAASQNESDQAKALLAVENGLNKLLKIVGTRKASPAEPSFTGGIRTQVDGLQCIQPRGKYTFIFREGGLVLLKCGEVSEDTFVGWSDFKCVVRFPKPDPYKSDKNGTSQFVLMALKCSVGKSKISAIVVQVDGKKHLQVSLAPTGDETEPLLFQGPEPETLSAAVVSAASAVASVGRVGSTDPAVFQSSASLPYVGCYWGVRDGHLYPLRAGMVFFKPPLFLPIDNIAGMSISSDPRRKAVEMTVEMEDGAKYEFGQIVKEELEPLQRYASFIAKRREAAAKISLSSSSKDCSGEHDGGGGGEDEDEDDDDDDDFEPSGSSEYSGSDEDGDETGDEGGDGEAARGEARAAGGEQGDDGDEEDDEEDDDEDDDDEEDDEDEDDFEAESNPALSGDEGEGCAEGGNPKAVDGPRSMRSKRCLDGEHGGAKKQAVEASDIKCSRTTD